MGGHIENGRIVGLEPTRPPVVRWFAASRARGGNHHPSRPAPTRQTASKNGCSRRCRCHPRNDFPGNLSQIQRGNFFIEPTKERRIAPFESDNDLMFLCCTDQQPVNLGLLGGFARIALTNKDLLSLRRMIEHLGPNQRVIQHEIRPLEHPEGTQRQEVSGTRTGANKPDLPG